MKISFIISIFGLLSFTQISNQANENVKFKIFCTAMNNNSESPNYVVILVRNLNTNEKKEICTEAPFLNGAIGIETGEFYLGFNCKKNNSRYFEFAKDRALKNINFDLYSANELEAYSKTFNVNEIVQKVKNGKLSDTTFRCSKKEQLMFAHLMFNNGVLVTRGDLVGNICELKYFSEE